MTLVYEWAGLLASFSLLFSFGWLLSALLIYFLPSERASRAEHRRHQKELLDLYKDHR